MSEGVAQAGEVVERVRAVMDEALVAAYLHGSATSGGLRRHSDVDVLGMLARRMTDDERRTVVERLMEISGSRAMSGPARPVELTLVVASDVQPWRYPPRMEFQYGEWLRDDYERGIIPGPAQSADLAIVLAMASETARPLYGPAEALPVAVPRADLRRALIDSLPELLIDLETDRNVVLTLARSWLTLETGRFAPKDVAADWALARLPERLRRPLARARATYLDEVPETEPDLTAIRAYAEYVTGQIDLAQQRPRGVDSLRPDPALALSDWQSRVDADREQVERAREVADPADFYAPVAHRFRVDPRRTDDATLNVLLEHARADETWLDIGAGGGRYALPLALRVRELVAVEPSAAMLAALREDAAAEGIGNVRPIQGRWPVAFDRPSADVSLLAHVGYDIGDIGPFLDAMEAATRRLCLAVMGESAMATVATLFWHEIHGELRVRLPALPELLVLLLARDRLPEVRLVDRVPPSFETVDEALAMARRQLWVKEGSAKDRRLVELVGEWLLERDGRFTFDDRRSKIGIVTWAPLQP